MKLKQTYLRHFFDCDFKVLDHLVFEDNDTKRMLEYVNSKSSIEITNDDPKDLFRMIQNIHDTCNYCRTKFAREQHYSIIQSQLNEISPVLKFIFAELEPKREKFAKYADKFEKTLGINPLFLSK